jgi:superfamily II DNA or RNA helicase/transcriptional regulator with XRE-family HTH domain
MQKAHKNKIQLPDNFPDRVRALRIKYELTQVRMARIMGVSFATVNRWENGQSRPSPLAWQQILRGERYGLDGLTKDFAPSMSIKEPTATYGSESQRAGSIDFTTDPEIVRVVAEGHRLTYGHLFNPAFAVEISRIDSLPHQRIAVYEHMLAQPRLRFLLADDAGAGKTIMAGVYIREMLARRLLRRVLIVPPAGLVGNWQREMRQLFNMTFRVVRGTDARSGNPFKDLESDLLIISIDTLAGERMFSRLQEAGVEPYDLVIFDEAHKLSARKDPDGTFRATDRYRLGEALAGIVTDKHRWELAWSTRHLLLLTATPHMGKDFPYYCLWRLLEPEVLSTYDAFTAYPSEAKRLHFIRRTKEEMVRYDGSRIYPERISDTLSYGLSQGEVSEQSLYDKTTRYIQSYYNKARLLSRAAARFAMSIFQRRLASSTYALIRSFERRIEKLEQIIDDIQSGSITAETLAARQMRLDKLEDIIFSKTADEEEMEEGQEEHEGVEDQALGGTIAVNLAELEVERQQVVKLLGLARQVYDAREESKFEKLREVLSDSRFKDEKFIIFTEHRDTLNFLVRRLEGLGYTGKVAQIHGGMDYQERDVQVEFFRKPSEEGGASYLVATDAAGEGINLQFCWLMINYDIPWNPARLEQRMGRIHRYGQEHDPVIIINLVAGKTREGRVLKTLLDKLEKIRDQLRSDKVYDVIGRVFENVSIKEYMERAVTEEAIDELEKTIEGHLTKEQVKAIEERERILYGESGDVSKELTRLRNDLSQEVYCRLLPGYVRRFVQKSSSLIDIDIEGDLDGVFSFRAGHSGGLDFLWPAMEAYSEHRQNLFTVNRKQENRYAVFMHPGEMVFDTLCDHICRQYGSHALKGGIFVDPMAESPYFFHLALIKVQRQADLNFKPFEHSEILEYRLVGLKQDENNAVEECPLEYLLLLRGCNGLPPAAIRFAATIRVAVDQAREHAFETIAKGLAGERKQASLCFLPEREDFVRRGYHYQEAELATWRIELSKKVREGDSKAKIELPRIKERQCQLSELREKAIEMLRREPELIVPEDVEFLVHALVVPSGDPASKKRQDKAIEDIAVKVVWSFEDAEGAIVKDVSNPARAREAGLLDWPGFDLLSVRPNKEERDIEVKGRARVGDIEISENEWAKACNLRDQYWLYVVYNCASSYPRLVRIQDPFGKLIVKARGGVLIGQNEIFGAGES